MTSTEPISAPLQPAPGDKHVTRDGEDYAVALAGLIPQGQAWPRAWDGALMRVIRGLTRIWGDFEIRASALLEQESDPRTTLELLPDWERNWGLPDPCYEEPQTIGERQRALVQRMTIQGAQSREFFIGIAADIGYTITITEYRPFFIAMDGVGDCRQFGAAGAPDPLMRNKWHQPILNARGDMPVIEGELSEWPCYGLGDITTRYYWTVHIDDAKLVWFRVGGGGGQTGVDPHLRIGTADDLECLLERWKPAHTEIIFDYSGIAPPIVTMAGDKTVAENAAIGTVVGTLVVENKFTGTPVFALADDAGGRFSVTGHDLKVAGAFDFETATEHTVMVTVTGIDPPTADSYPFKIAVTDIEEPTWLRVFSMPLVSGDSNGLSGYNLRQSLLAGYFPDKHGTKVRLTLQGSASEGTRIDSIYAGHAAVGFLYNFDGNQKQIKVGGVGAFTIPKNGTVVTDPIDIAFNPKMDFLVSMHLDTVASDAVPFSYPISGVRHWTKAGASEAAATTITGYSTTPSYLFLISKIEILTQP